MDSALRTISYIADIGSIVVLMARRRMSQASSEDFSESPDSGSEGKNQYRMICYVFESEDVSVSCSTAHPFFFFFLDVFIWFLYTYLFCGQLNHCDLSHTLAVVNWDSLSAE